MSEQQNHPDKIELIYLMLDLGYRILVVEGRHYIVKEFTAAEDSGAYNSFKGSDITTILKSFPNYKNIDKTQVNKLAQKLTNAAEFRLNFSSQHKWKLYMK